MTKICVYAICKNESKFINRWLASMSEADYIVVLDTGSTDGTYEKLMSDHRIKKVKQTNYILFIKLQYLKTKGVQGSIHRLG